MQSKQEIFWITLGQRKNIPAIGFEEMQGETKRLLDDLRQHARAKKRNWKYAIHGTVANIHGSDVLKKIDRKHPFRDCVGIDGEKSPLADMEVIDADVVPLYCRYHVHLAMLATPGHSVAKYIVKWWKKHGIGDKNSICVKYGRADHKGPLGVWNIEGVFKYIALNHRYSQRAKWIDRRCPSSGRVSRDAAMSEIRDGYENLAITIHNEEVGIKLDTARSCDMLEDGSVIPF